MVQVAGAQVQRILRPCCGADVLREDVPALEEGVGQQHWKGPFRVTDPLGPVPSPGLSGWEAAGSKHAGDWVCEKCEKSMLGLSQGPRSMKKRRKADFNMISPMLLQR